METHRRPQVEMILRTLSGELTITVPASIAKGTLQKKGQKYCQSQEVCCERAVLEKTRPENGNSGHVNMKSGNFRRVPSSDKELWTNI